MERNIRISDYDYPLPEGRIAKFPLERREQSKLLVCRDGRIAEDRFERIGRFLPEGSMLVFNNTKVIRARLIFHKATGARIEIFCLEPHVPADYERAFAAHDRCRWQCIVGNLKKWKDGPLQIAFGLGGRTYRLEATRTGDGGGHQIVEFVWDAPLAFGQLLEELGRIPIPPYLCRESEELDNSRYQTVYSRFEGSVAAPTAGLHFTPEVIGRLRAEGHPTAEVTLHVGAGTVMTEAQLKLATEAGAEYIISPNVDTAIIRATKAVGLISIPGAFTPSEIAGAYQAGADFVKLFPADCVDLKYIKAVCAPINHIPLLAVSGVTPENLGDYLNAGMAGAGIGSILVTKADVANEDYDAIAQRAARYVAVVESV